jgi:hypothetical protein
LKAPAPRRPSQSDMASRLRQEAQGIAHALNAIEQALGSLATRSARVAQLGAIVESVAAHRQSLERELGELMVLVRERNGSKSVERAAPELVSPPVQPRVLQASKRWQPSAQDLLRGRAAVLQEFDRPENLPLREFAQLARKSRQQIYKDINAHRLLALSIGRHGQRIPSWQLQPAAKRTTELVLEAASRFGIDSWTLYVALTSGDDAFAGRTPIEAATTLNAQQVAAKVCAGLGIRPQEIRS